MQKFSFNRWGRRGTAAATIAASLSFDEVHHQYGEKKALNGINLTIEAGELMCLLGESGCGKTTLLRIAAGIEQQTSGTVCINDAVVADSKLFLSPEKRGVGLMFQDYALFPHLSIIDNIAFGLNNLSKKDAMKEATAVLRRVGLEKYMMDFPHTLSGGEQQRIALARAIAPRPGVLLMDEPFSGLDRNLRHLVREETMAVLRETRATSLMVTHDPIEALLMSDRIALMRDGEIVQVGCADEFYNSPKNLFVARFFMNMNEFVTNVASGKVMTPLGEFDVPRFEDGTEVTVCFKQEDVQFSQDERGVVGRIIAKRFMGDFSIADIHIEGSDQSVFAKVSKNDKSAIGDDVRITINPSNILIFDQ